jgi:hypothetical protein
VKKHKRVRCTNSIDADRDDLADAAVLPEFRTVPNFREMLETSAVVLAGAVGCG